MNCVKVRGGRVPLFAETPTNRNYTTSLGGSYVGSTQQRKPTPTVSQRPDDVSPDGSARQDLAWQQLECSNAFGELSRTKCLQAPQDKAHHLPTLEAQWLASRAMRRKTQWNSGPGPRRPVLASSLRGNAATGEIPRTIVKVQQDAKMDQPVMRCFTWPWRCRRGCNKYEQKFNIFSAWCAYTPKQNIQGRSGTTTRIVFSVKKQERGHRG